MSEVVAAFCTRKCRSLRHHCTHIIIELILISNNQARDAASSTVPITHSRRSPEQDWGIVWPSQLNQCQQTRSFRQLRESHYSPRFRLGGNCRRLSLRNPAAANAGILPRPGQVRLMLGNATDEGAIITINEQTIELAARAGRNLRTPPTPDANRGTARRSICGRASTRSPSRWRATCYGTLNFQIVPLKLPPNRHDRPNSSTHKVQGPPQLLVCRCAID